MSWFQKLYLTMRTRSVSIAEYVNQVLETMSWLSCAQRIRRRLDQTLIRRETSNWDGLMDHISITPPSLGCYVRASLTCILWTGMIFQQLCCTSRVVTRWRGANDLFPRSGLWRTWSDCQSWERNRGILDCYYSPLWRSLTENNNERKIIKRANDNNHRLSTSSFREWLLYKILGNVCDPHDMCHDFLSEGTFFIQMWVAGRGEGGAQFWHPDGRHHLWANKRSCWARNRVTDRSVKSYLSAIAMPRQKPQSNESNANGGLIDSGPTQNMATHAF